MLKRFFIVLTFAYSFTGCKPDHSEVTNPIQEDELTDEQIDDLVAFMEALTSPEYAQLANAAGGE